MPSFKKEKTVHVMELVFPFNNNNNLNNTIQNNITNINYNYNYNKWINNNNNNKSPVLRFSIDSMHCPFVVTDLPSSVHIGVCIIYLFNLLLLLLFNYIYLLCIQRLIEGADSPLQWLPFILLLPNISIHFLMKK